MFPKHSAGPVENELAVVQRAMDLSLTLLPVGVDATEATWSQWRADAMAVLYRVNTMSKGRHTHGTPVLEGNPWHLVTNHSEKPADSDRHALLAGLSNAWVEMGGRTGTPADVPAEFDKNLVKALATLTAFTSAE